MNRLIPIIGVALIAACVIFGLPDGTIFGAFDNGLVILGAYAGVDIEARLARAMSRDPDAIMGAVVGSSATNLLSDGAGCAFDPAMQGMMAGVALGCLIPMLFIPALEAWRSRRVANLEQS